MSNLLGVARMVDTSSGNWVPCNLFGRLDPRSTRTLAPRVPRPAGCSAPARGRPTASRSAALRVPARSWAYACRDAPRQDPCSAYQRSVESFWPLATEFGPKAERRAEPSRVLERDSNVRSARRPARVCRFRCGQPSIGAVSWLRKPSTYACVRIIQPQCCQLKDEATRSGNAGAYACWPKPDCPHP